MKQRLQSSLLVGMALAAMVVTPTAEAGVNTDTISIHFGADEPTQVTGSMLDPTDVVGVPAVASANWNNVATKGGVSASLIRDANGGSDHDRCHRPVGSDEHLGFDGQRRREQSLYGRERDADDGILGPKYQHPFPHLCTGSKPTR